MQTTVSSPPCCLDGVPPFRGGRTQWNRIRKLSTPRHCAEQRLEWEEAWRYLFEAFRPAMLAVVTRVLARVGGGAVSPDEAEDIVQSFFLTCVEKDYLARARPARGRFRTFLTVCLRRHTMKYVERRRRKKRAPPAPPRSWGQEIPDRRIHEPTNGGERTHGSAWMESALRAALLRVEARSAPNAHVLRMLYETPDLDLEGLALRLDEPKPRISLRLHRARCNPKTRGPAWPAPCRKTSVPLVPPSCSHATSASADGAHAGRGVVNDRHEKVRVWVERAPAPPSRRGGEDTVRK